MHARCVPSLIQTRNRPRGSDDRIRIGYVSSDLNNHPLSHLMASVFGLHDKSQFQVRAQF
jgi:predicted O-linked N-acetylglucosamine transferase (SPINDLY family)